jgi:hypothetical protein
MRDFRQDRAWKYGKTERVKADEVFEEVLRMLWVSVVQPTFSALGLKVR